MAVSCCQLDVSEWKKHRDATFLVVYTCLWRNEFYCSSNGKNEKQRYYRSSPLLKDNRGALAYWTKVVPKKRAFNRLTLSTRMPTVRMTKTSPMFWSKMISSAVRGCLLHSLQAQESAPALLWARKCHGNKHQQPKQWVAADLLKEQVHGNDAQLAQKLAITE
jgi:hypothetical protein